MLFLGILSLLQIIFLPGFLLLRGIKFFPGTLSVIILSFPLSLIINHFIVFALTAVHLYGSYAMYSILIVEIALLAAAGWPCLNRPVMEYVSTLSAAMLSNTSRITHDENMPLRIVKILSFVLAVLTVAFFVKVALGSAGQVFNSWDDVVSWNKWAVQWANGELPTMVWHYPQLLPANWSLSYVFISDDSVQFFAKAVMPLFSVFMLLALLELTFATREFAYVIATILTGGMLLFMNENSAITSGYADIPVAFMSFMSIYLLLRPKTAHCDAGKQIILGAAMAAGAALTKQAGLFIVILYPLALYLLPARQDGAGDKRHKTALTAVLMMAAMLAPWYLWNEYRIYTGSERSEIASLLGSIHNGRTYGERLIHGKSLLVSRNAFLTNKLNPAVQQFVNFSFLAALLAIFGGAFNRTGKKILLLIVIPYFLIWAFFYSYDIRNATLIVPFAGVAAGFGTLALAGPLSSVISRLARLKAAVSAGAAILALFALSLWVGPDSLKERQVELQMKIGDRTVNDFLYSYYSKHPLEGKILSNYYMMGHLPGLKEHYGQEQFSELEALKDNIKTTEAKYLFLIAYSNSPEKRVRDYIEGKLYSGEFEIVSGNGGYTLIEIKKGQP